MVRLWVLIGLIRAGVVTVVALVLMGQLVRGSHSACDLYPYTSGCR
jgi:hypothetical protein